LENIANEICGKVSPKKRKQWITTEILQKMDERRKYTKTVVMQKGDRSINNLREKYRDSAEKLKLNSTISSVVK